MSSVFAITYLQISPIMEALNALMSGACMVKETSESHFQTVYGAASALNYKAAKSLVYFSI